MACVRTRGTAPELEVRRTLHALGYRFRLHRDDLPGRPDIVLAGRRAVVFVHGCFWHHHGECAKGTLPATNCEFWARKIARTVDRDQENVRDLRQRGWRTLVVWECQARQDSLSERLLRFLEGESLERDGDARTLS